MVQVGRNSDINMHRSGPVFLDQEGTWRNFVVSSVGRELRKPTLLLEASSSEIVSTEDTYFSGDSVPLPGK